MRAEGFKVRAYEPSDLQAAKQMVQETFPFFQRFSLVFEEGVFILEDPDQKIYGMIKGKVIKTSLKTIGVISWLMIPKAVQSKGFAGPLMDSLLEYFEQQNCDEVLGCAHQLNTASSGGMTYFGFKPISLVKQLRSYRFDIFYVWKKAYHVFDYGHILWCKSKDESNQIQGRDSFSLHFFINIVMLILISLRVHGYPSIEMLCSGASYLFLRHFFVKSFLSKTQSELRYQGWESGYLLSGIIGVIIGFWIPCPGLMVPQTDRWRVKKWEAPMFRAALSISLVIALLSILLHFNDFSFGKYLLSFVWIELIFVFFPFQGLLGGWLFKRSKWVYFLMTIVFTAIFGMIQFNIFL